MSLKVTKDATASPVEYSSGTGITWLLSLDDFATADERMRIAIHAVNVATTLEEINDIQF